MKRRPTIQALPEVLKHLVQDLGISPKLDEYEAVLRWEHVVGPRIAEVAHAERIMQGVLVVRVAASTWRHELNMRKPEIIARLNSELGAETVKDIRFR
jgi:predicted nucleic acid-binding Zn ribbon protein